MIDWHLKESFERCVRAVDVYKKGACVRCTYSDQKKNIWGLRQAIKAGRHSLGHNDCNIEI